MQPTKEPRNGCLRDGGRYRADHRPSAGLVSRWLKFNERRQAQPPADDLLRREVASLRERVATLEQIVTDPAFELKRQFAALETRKAA
ncbi:MAG: hypothetical protein IPK27_00605 [Rhodanobacteraceae bacterium]|nr:hypothetical protein [Rhodanobacteraceae bacterium]